MVDCEMQKLTVPSSESCDGQLGSRDGDRLAGGRLDLRRQLCEEERLAVVVSDIVRIDSVRMLALHASSLYKLLTALPLESD